MASGPKLAQLDGHDLDGSSFLRSAGWWWWQCGEEGGERQQNDEDLVKRLTASCSLRHAAHCGVACALHQC